jgi:hypothetical protein
MACSTTSSNPESPYNILEEEEDEDDVSDVGKTDKSCGFFVLFSEAEYTIIYASVVYVLEYYPNKECTIYEDLLNKLRKTYRHSRLICLQERESNSILLCVKEFLNEEDYYNQNETSNSINNSFTQKFVEKKIVETSHKIVEDIELKI